MYWNHIRHKGFVWNDRFLTSIQSLVFLEFSSLASLSEYCWYCLQSIPSCTAWNYRYFHHWHSWYCLQFIPSCTAQYYRYFHHWHNWASTVGTVCIPSRHVHCTLPKHHSYFKQVLHSRTAGKFITVLPLEQQEGISFGTAIRYFILEQKDGKLSNFGTDV